MACTPGLIVSPPMSFGYLRYRRYFRFQHSALVTPMNLEQRDAVR